MRARTPARESPLRRARMKAAVYDATRQARDVLKVTEVERPEPGPGEVRVRVHVSGVNPTDAKSRSGATPRPIDGFRSRPGWRRGDRRGGRRGGPGPRRAAGLAVPGRRRAEVGNRGRMDRAAGAPGGAAAGRGGPGAGREPGRPGDHRAPLRVRGRPGGRSDRARRGRRGRCRPFRHRTCQTRRCASHRYGERPGEG